MTQEEAAQAIGWLLNGSASLHNMIDNAFGYFMADKLMQALKMARNILTETCTVEPPKSARLDENGLMLCGCGGKASEYFVEHPYVDKGSYVECRWCRINVVGVNKQDARERWNTVMGWRENK